MSAKAKTVKNAKPAKTIRNVLVQPFKTKWPLVNENDAKRVTQLLTNIPENLITVGTNAALELLHSANACAVILTSEFHPQILGKQIIRMARRNFPAIQILAIPGLEWDGSLQKMIAIKGGEQRVGQLDLLLQAMEEIIQSNDFKDDLCSSQVSIKKQKLKQKKPVTKIGPEKLSQLYLVRSNSNQRAFIPKISSFATKSKGDKGDWGEFISFHKSTPESMEIESAEELEQKVESKLNSSGKLNVKSSDNLRPQNGPYICLTVNRIQGDPNRRKNPKMKKSK